MKVDKYNHLTTSLLRHILFHFNFVSSLFEDLASASAAAAIGVATTVRDEEDEKDERQNSWIQIEDCSNQKQMMMTKVNQLLIQYSFFL